jgi:hypothetical protein
MARPRRPIEEAREFGYLVGVERPLLPKKAQYKLFECIRRRDPKRWKSMSAMNRLWRAYKEDCKRNRVEAAEWALRRSMSQEQLAELARQQEERLARHREESRIRELVREMTTEDI